MPDDARPFIASSSVAPAPATAGDLIVTLASELPALFKDSTTYTRGDRLGPKAEAADARIEAIENLIARTEATSLQGAAVQLMIAAGCLGGVRGAAICEENAEYIEGELGRANRLVESALAAIRRTTGDGMARFQIAFYAPDHMWPFPSEPIPTPDLIEPDGAAAAREIKHPDAELIALAERRADLYENHDLAEDTAASDELADVEQRIAKTSARSFAGFAVRLQQLRREIEYITTEFNPPSERLADALIADLERLLPGLKHSATPTASADPKADAPQRERAMDMVKAAGDVHVALGTVLRLTQSTTDTPGVSIRHLAERGREQSSRLLEWCGDLLNE